MRLSQRLAAGVVALTVIISLYPLVGWRVPADVSLAFLWAPLPRVLTAVDVAGNVLAYIPLGAQLLLALLPALGVRRSVGVALAASAGLSLGLEVLQQFLPSRVPSNVDVACNVLGAVAGIGLGLRWRHQVERGGALQYAWQRLRAEGQAQETGVAVLLVWLLAQWSPEVLPFAVGAVRPMAGLAALADFSVARFIDFETAIVAIGALAAGLPAALMLRRHRRRLALAIVALGAAAKSAGMAMLGAGALLWLTPGALRGLAIGAAGLVALATLRPSLQRGAAMLCIVLVAVLANGVPDNPYHLPSLPAFPAAQWLHLDGLSRLAGVVWPLLALGWLWQLRTEN